MKWLFVFIIVILSGCKQSSKEMKEDYIEIKYLDFNTTATFQISCEVIESMNETKSIRVESKQELAKFKETLGTFLPVSDKSFDARGKIFFIVDGRKTEYCFDKFGTFYAISDGYFKNFQMFALIEHVIR